MTELSVAEQTLVGRITGGHVADLTAAQALTLLDISAVCDSQRTWSVNEWLFSTTTALETGVDSSFNYAVKAYGSSAQNNTIVYLLPRALQAGTYTFTLEHWKDTNLGIITYEMSPDNATWTSVAVVDFYAAAGVRTITTVTGIVLGAGLTYFRGSALSKNVSASLYYQYVGSFDMTRTA